MARDLAAELGVALAHGDLEEGVADPVPVRLAATLAHRVGHRPAGADVVEDPCAGPLFEQLSGEQRREEVPVDEDAGVVDEEAAVGVAVPGDAEVGALVEHPIDHELTILG